MAAAAPPPPMLPMYALGTGTVAGQGRPVDMLQVEGHFSDADMFRRYVYHYLLAGRLTELKSAACPDQEAKRVYIMAGLFSEIIPDAKKMNRAFGAAGGVPIGVMRAAVSKQTGSPWRDGANPPLIPTGAGIRADVITMAEIDGYVTVLLANDEFKNECVKKIRELVLTFVLSMSTMGNITGGRISRATRHIATQTGVEILVDRSLVQTFWGIWGNVMRPIDGQDGAGNLVVRTWATFFDELATADSGILRLSIIVQQSRQGGATAAVVITNAMLEHPNFPFGLVCPGQIGNYDVWYAAQSQNPYHCYPGQPGDAMSYIKMVPTLLWVSLDLLINMSGERSLRDYNGLQNVKVPGTVRAQHYLDRYRAWYTAQQTTTVADTVFANSTVHQVGGVAVAALG